MDANTKTSEQRCDKKRVIAGASRTLSRSEQNYTKLEFLTLKLAATEKFSDYFILFIIFSTLLLIFRLLLN